MKNIKLGDQVYEGVETVRLDTAEGGTVDYAPYQETFAAGRTEGYNAGKEAGLEEGFDNGKASGIEEGIQTEYDRFWDIYQENGKRTNYTYAFAGKGWAKESFKPKYDLTASYAATSMFGYQSLYNLDLSNLLAELNIKLDTTGCTTFIKFAEYSSARRFPELNVTGADSLDNTFYHATIETVDHIILRDDGSQTVRLMFIGCSNLKNITLSGCIGKEINFQWSTALSVDSMKSVITHLKNYAGTAEAGTHKVTFTDVCWAALEADSAAPDGNTWRDYVETTLGWLT